MALTYIQKQQHASGTMTEREREVGNGALIQFLFSLDLCGLGCICNKIVYYFNEHSSVDKWQETCV